MSTPPTELEENTTQQKTDPVGLAAWTERISQEEMPVFSRTANDLSNLVSDEASHRSQLTSSILQDAAMTARVLRLANSTFYNPSGQQLSTISRAVLVLGVNGLRNLCVSASLVDSLLKKNPREQLLKEMGRAFYAAALARSLAEARKDGSPEEVFVATLLYRLGEMAFWCFSKETAEAVEQEMREREIPKEEAIMHVLGFSLSELSETLAKSWKLGDLLQSSFQDTVKNDRAKQITLTNRLASALEHTDDNEEIKKLIGQIAKLSGSAEENVLKLVENASREAQQAARGLGAWAAAKRVPKYTQTVEPAVEAKAPKKKEAPPPVEEVVEILQPDPLLQLKILRELTLLREQADFNSIIEIVLEGIYRGIGMDRAFFALLTPDRSHLRAKFNLGASRTLLTERFDLAVGTNERHIFSQVIEKQLTLWIPESKLQSSLQDVPKGVQELLSNGAFLVTAAVVNGRPIGLFYADRQSSKRSLDSESFDCFRLFSQQANMLLDSVTRQK